MSMRVITPAGGAASVTVTALNDPYSTQVTFPAGTTLDVVPGGPWETSIGLSNLTALAGNALVTDQTGSGGPATSNS